MESKMNEKNLVEKVRLIKDLADSIIREHEGHASNIKVASRVGFEKSKKKTDVTGSIKGLLGQDFFNQGKTDTDVIQRLKKQALNVKRGSISVALMRLVRQGLLIREGDGKKKNPWRYKTKTQE